MAESSLSRHALRRMTLEALASEWRSATLFPADEPEMKVIVTEFQDRGVPMRPVLDDYQRRLELAEHEKHANKQQEPGR